MTSRCYLVLGLSGGGLIWVGDPVEWSPDGAGSSWIQVAPELIKAKAMNQLT